MCTSQRRTIDPRPGSGNVDDMQQTALHKQLHREVHVWTAVPERVCDPAGLAALRALLSVDERTRYQRFRCVQAAHQYLVAHGMLRSLLSRYADVKPADWQFVYGDHGRPEIANHLPVRLRFNLTHTDGLIACAVSQDRTCGIDAERCVARRHFPGIARRMFSDNECRALERTQGRARLEGFYSGWTLREAYVKARGIGISFPTRKLDFTVRRDDDIGLTQAPDIAGSGDDWYFRLMRPTEEHLLAIAVARNGDSDIRVIQRDFQFDQPLSTTGS